MPNCVGQHWARWCCDNLDQVAVPACQRNGTLVLEQIDNIYTNETSNGLTYAIEKFKDADLAGHITFRKGERSKIATLASKVL